MKLLYRILIFFAVLIALGVAIVIWIGFQIHNQRDGFSHQWGPSAPEESHPDVPAHPDFTKRENRAEKVQFSSPHGYYEEALDLELSSATPGASIWFTTDATIPIPEQPGSQPNGRVYKGPISIARSTTVTAVNFAPGKDVSLPVTQTYLFLEDILKQDKTSATSEGWPARPDNGKRMDYGMDPDIVNRFSKEEWKEAFSQISTLSIVTEQGNLTSSKYGIYANPGGQGKGWERFTSVELIDKDGGTGFQTGAGLRIRGGFTRNRHFVKHSFRLFFRKQYGAGKLKYPLFEAEGADRFDKIDLRTAQNYSWARGEGRRSGSHNTLVREVFCRDTQRDMGSPYTRSRYYHLFLNRQYWGIYMTEERPEAAYGATYFSGDRQDFDTLKCANFLGKYVLEATDGDTKAWQALWEGSRKLAKNPSDETYDFLTGKPINEDNDSKRAALVDVDNLINYMLITFYAGNSDGPLSAFLGNRRSNNWFAIRNRESLEGFRFFVHDAEHTLGAPESAHDRTGPFRSSNQDRFKFSNPQWIHQDLAEHPDYRRRFSQLAHKHLTGDGALTTERAVARFQARAAQIDKAIKAQSARWGDAEHRNDPYQVEDWEQRIQWVIDEAITGREHEIIEQLKEDGLYTE